MKLLSLICLTVSVSLITSSANAETQNSESSAQWRAQLSEVPEILYEVVNAEPLSSDDDHPPVKLSVGLASGNRAPIFASSMLTLKKVLVIEAGLGVRAQPEVFMHNVAGEFYFNAASRISILDGYFQLGARFDKKRSVDELKDANLNWSNAPQIAQQQAYNSQYRNLGYDMVITFYRFGSESDGYGKVYLGISSLRKDWTPDLFRVGISFDVPSATSY